MKRRSTMHMLLASLLCASALSVHAAADTPATAASPQLARTLQSLADKADATWNRRDAAAMAAMYARDATSTIGGGIRLKGREEILAYFTASFGKLPAGMTHRTVVRRIEPIGDMLATDSAVFIEVPDGAGGKRVAREFFTFGLVRPVGQDWEFVAVRAAREDNFLPQHIDVAFAGGDARMPGEGGAVARDVDGCAAGIGTEQHVLAALVDPGEAEQALAEPGRRAVVHVVVARIVLAPGALGAAAVGDDGRLLPVDGRRRQCQHPQGEGAHQARQRGQHDGFRNA